MWIIVFIITVCVFFHSEVLSQQTMPYTDCRITMKEPRGVITTPNFPNPYPVPINCQWVIEAPADKVIAVYFTQFYMREGLRATEYAYYSQNVKMGKTEFGTISSEREPTYLVSNKPVLVLDFAVREQANIHMRVREFLLDVFGFNITYEMIARNESVRKDACLYHHCSFTGNCYASSGHDRYYCSCFAKYFGDECQYDSDCGPTASRNMCQNGGTCRYYIGSTVRTCECPPGYDGAKCESRKTARPPAIGCTGPSCNITCSPSKENQKGCPQTEGRQRYIVALKITNPKVSIILSERKKMENFKREMERALLLLLKTRLEVSENITVLELRPDSVMRFHLLGKKSDGEELKSTVEEMLKLGKLGSFDFDQEYYGFESEPALKIERMEASERMPVVEGTELTLACMVQGSNGLQVEWFKDGIPVYVHTTQRGMWTTIVPKNSQDQFTALLGFDRATILDSGVFTCRITDWGFVQNKSVQVIILSAPQPQLTPMAATIFQGHQLVVTCLSKEDIYGTFGYTWLKNGQILNPSTEPEMIEDLFPAGSRVLLRSAKASATYTCIITSSAGSTRKESVITVLDNGRAIPTCPPDEYMKVRWSLAASNTEDRQLCPIGYTGDVRRPCSLSTTRGAFWEEPDFSECFSSSFLAIKRKVDSLRLGYLLTDVTSLLHKVKRYLLVKRPKLHVSEGEPVVDILEDIQGISHVDKRSQEGWQVFLDIVSTLLESPILIRKHSKIIQLHEQIFKYGFQYAATTNDVSFESFSRKYLAVEVGKIHQGLEQFLKFPSQRYSRSAKYSEEPMEQSPWMSNSVEVDLGDWQLNENEEEGNSTGAVVVVFYKNLSAYLPQRFVTKKGTLDIEYQLISSLVEVRIKEKYFRKDMDLNVKVKLSSFNHTVEKRIGWNITCAMADFSQGRIQFTTSGCQMIWTTKNITLCGCQRLGTYALLLTHYSLPEDIHVEDGFEIIAGIGCTICAFFLLISFALLLCVWRKIRRAITALKLQVCVALLGAYVTFFCGLDNSLSEEFYPYTVTLIQFFLLTAFSLQLCLALAVYIECIDLKNIHYSSAKIAAIGWTVPVIVLGATLAAQSLDGFNLKGWWLPLGSTFFYAYTSSILILTVFQVILFLTVKSEIRNYGKVADFLQKKKVRVNTNRVKLLHRSLLMTTTLLLVSVASILYVNFNSKIFEYFFAASSAMLGLVVFLSYTFCSEKHFILCCLDEASDDHSEHEDSSIRSRNNSFKSFLKPEIIDDTYSNKLHFDTEKRTDRIKRMYTQIERASLSKSSDPLHQQCIEATTELLSHHHNSHQGTPEDTHRPIVLSSRHSVDHSSTNGSPHKLTKDKDVFCNPQDDGSGYPRMHWRYASHPHTMYGSPGGHVNYGGTHIDHMGVQRPFLLESDSERHRLSDFENGGHFHDSTSHELSSSTFQPSQTVKADITMLRSSQHSIGKCLPQNTSFSDVSDVQDVPDNDDGCSLKNSCFMHHTDSLETVVYCDNAPSGSDVANVKQPPSWNMTSV